MREELACSVAPDAVEGSRMRGLADILFVLALLAIPLSVIANRGLVPLAVMLALTSARRGRGDSVRIRCP